ncbi:MULTISPECIES: N-acetylmuramoyl-L-alanine amidase [Helcococcus]|uniref:N-acetylmuramoyl-L-alanine amidase n=1 Tax=Helcococcus bovis TaxID=3153252 RepID=A0ABW9F5P0_9FIRM
MSNSSLVNYVKLSPNHSGLRKNKIDTITIHHMAGNLSVETCGEVFYPRSREASSNYGVDSKGRVGMYVEEKNRSWCSSSPENDHRAVTIEVANDEFGGNWHVSDKALEKTIELCVDICRRNGIKRLNYTGDTRGNLTKHEWFANTNCPGPYLGSKFPYIANEVNRRLGVSTSKTTSSNRNTKSLLYRVRKSWKDAKSQKDAFKVLDNAKKCADKNKGFFVFDKNGKVVYPVTSSKSVDNIAREVINGKWGNGDERKRRLTNAGYDYNLVQDRVNSILNNKPVNKKSLEEVAREVINGDWGNGSIRKNKLEAAGYDYAKVQDLVNKLL